MEGVYFFRNSKFFRVAIREVICEGLRIIPERGVTANS